jgi:predicted RNA-binding protein with RPS1 domain
VQFKYTPLGADPAATPPPPPRSLQQRPAVRRASSRFLRSAAASAEPEVAAPAEAAPAEAAPAEAAPADAAPAERRAPRAGGNRRGGGGGSRPLIGPERAFGIDDIVVGKTYDGAVVSMTDFGAFVNIGCQTDGLLHISQISAAFVRDVKEALTIGQPVSVRVLTVDQQRGKFAVTAIPEGEEPPRGRRDDAYEGDGGFGGGGGGAGGARQERPRQATRGAQKQRRNSAPLAVTLGETLTAAITSVAPFGVFVDIGNGHNGMLHSSQMTLPEGVTDHVGHLKEGDELTVRVLRLERADKVALTQKSEEEVAADERTRTKGLAASGEARRCAALPCAAPAALRCCRAAVARRYHGSRVADAAPAAGGPRVRAQRWRCPRVPRASPSSWPRPASRPRTSTRWVTPPRPEARPPAAAAAAGSPARARVAPAAARREGLAPTQLPFSLPPVFSTLPRRPAVGACGGTAGAIAPL